MESSVLEGRRGSTWKRPYSAGLAEGHGELSHLRNEELSQEAGGGWDVLAELPQVGARRQGLITTTFIGCWMCAVTSGDIISLRQGNSHRG